MVIAVLVEIALVALLAWNWFGGRTSPERFAIAYGIALDEGSLPPVRAALHRTHVGRMLGGLVGALVLGCIALLIGWGAAAFGAFVGIVAGTMTGIAFAQLRRRPDPATVRHASLDARTVASYAPARAGLSITTAAFLCVGVSLLVVATAPAGLGPYTPTVVLGLVVLLIVPASRVLQRRIVEAPRTDLTPAVDDALRTSAVRAVHHSVLGILLCGVVVAGVGGQLTLNTMTVEVGGEVVFRAPPGSTSISASVGTRPDAAPDTGPIQVFWIEADGSEHQTDWLNVTGVPSYGNGAGGPVSILFSLVTLGAAAGVFVEWGRATGAWKRRGFRASSGPATVPTSVVSSA